MMYEVYLNKDIKRRRRRKRKEKKKKNKKEESSNHWNAHGQNLS